MNSDSYCGEWQLLPDLCLYTTGTPPPAGRYKLQYVGEEIAISISWTDASGIERQHSFGGPVDGVRRPISQPGVTHVSFTRVAANTLDSSAFNGEVCVAYARRVASAEAGLLTTIQTNFVDGVGQSNFQVYGRVAGLRKG